MANTPQTAKQGIAPSFPTTQVTDGGSGAAPSTTACYLRGGSEPRGRNPQPLASCYMLGPVLGAGSFSVVRTAVHRGTNTTYAVKSFLKNNEAGREAAYKEIALLQQAAHESVLRFVEYFDELAGVFLITELAPGRDAATCLAERGSYAEEDCITIARQLLQSLQQMHAMGIAHRDIKLENVVLGENDNLHALKLIDFGLASQRSSVKPCFTTPCGTPAFAAPEVLTTTQPRYGTSCDLWSLGCLVFTTLSGEPPFHNRPTAGGLRQLVLDIREGKYSMRDPAWELISDSAKDFVKQLLTVDPTQRPTAREALEHPWLQE